MLPIGGVVPSMVTCRNIKGRTVNIKMTWAFAGKLLLALVAGGVSGAAAGDSIGAMVGIGTCLAVIYAEKQKAK